MKRVTDLINEQVKRWETQQQQGEEAARAGQQKPMITVSSAYGAGGEQIGRQAAVSLGFDFFDRELVDKIAEAAAVRARLVETVDERTRSWIDEHIADQFEREHFSASDYLRHLSRVLLTLGRHGRMVLMGRGGHLILDPERTLRVRTVAPLPVRVRNISDQERMSEREARALVLTRDAERAAFARLHFNVDIADPERFDLVINTTLDEMQQIAAEVVVETFKRRFPT